MVVNVSCGPVADSVTDSDVLDIIATEICSEKVGIAKKVNKSRYIAFHFLSRPLWNKATQQQLNMNDQ